MTPAPGSGASGGELAAMVDRLIGQVAHWTPARWAASGASAVEPASGTGSRADLVHHLVQRLADLEAAATGRPAWPVPRLDSDLALPDQLRVVARDLLAAPASPRQLAAAVAAVRRTRESL